MQTFQIRKNEEFPTLSIDDNRLEIFSIIERMDVFIERACNIYSHYKINIIDIDW